MLGPARFTHFESCAREVCRAFRLRDDVETAVATLRSLDDILASLRSELARHTAMDTGAEPSASQAKAPDYTALEEELDLKKAKRLITARENSIKSVKTALRKAKPA